LGRIEGTVEGEMMNVIPNAAFEMKMGKGKRMVGIKS
jgi:hypothetical protein